MINRKKSRFIMPKEGTIKPNSNVDPLLLYSNPIAGSIFRYRFKQALSMLNPPYENILEIGYGSGILLPSLSKLGEKIYGIDNESDPNRVSRDLFGSKIKVNLIKEDIFSYVPLNNQKYDLIVAMSVFEHIKNIDLLIKKLFLLLKKNGELLVGMPRVDKIMGILFRMIGFNNIDDYHVTNYKEFIKSAKRCFNLLNIKTIPLSIPRNGALYYNMLLSRK